MNEISVKNKSFMRTTIIDSFILLTTTFIATQLINDDFSRTSFGFITTISILLIGGVYFFYHSLTRNVNSIRYDKEAVVIFFLIGSKRIESKCVAGTRWSRSFNEKLQGGRYAAQNTNRRRAKLSH